MFTADLALALTYLADAKRRYWADHIDSAIYNLEETRTFSLTVLSEAIGLCREAAAGPPPERPRLALALANLEEGRVYWSFSQPGQELTIRQVEGPVGSRPQAFIPDPDQYRVDLARALNRRAWSMWPLPGYEGAAMLTEAVELYRQAYKNDPVRHRMSLACNLWALGTTLRNLVWQRGGSEKQAKDAYIEAARLCLEAITTDPGRDCLFQLPMLDTLGRSLTELGCHREALLIETERVQQWRHQFEADPDKSRQSLASALESLAGALRALGRDPDAFSVQSEVVALYQELDTANPHHYRAELARSFSEFADLQTVVGHLDQAMKAHSAAIARYKALVAEDSGHQDYELYRAGLAIAFSRLAITLDLLGEHEEAAAIRQQAVKYGRN